MRPLLNGGTLGGQVCMKALRDHLALKNPRFRCRDTSEQHSLVVDLTSTLNPPASAPALDDLKALAGAEYVFLAPLYKDFNGIFFHGHGETFGLVVAPIEELREMATDYRESFYVDEADLYPFQRDGVAFATIFQSGNYFVCYRGRIYYSDHDGGDDGVWGEDLESFFARALSDPPKFLLDVGCYTRYSDGATDRQFIPEEFLHD
jgi:hypothetical protein